MKDRLIKGKKTLIEQAEERKESGCEIPEKMSDIKKRATRSSYGGGK